MENFFVINLFIRISRLMLGCIICLIQKLAPTSGLELWKWPVIYEGLLITGLTGCLYIS